MGNFWISCRIFNVFTCHYKNSCFGSFLLGIRKIHGPTDTRTLYTDLLNNIIFWKLEKYTDPIFWQFFRCHKSTRTQTHSKNSKFFMISILLNLCRSSKMAGHFGKSDFPTPKSQKAFENVKIGISWEVCKKIISCKTL